MTMFKDGYTGKVCQCSICGNYTKKVWKVTAERCTKKGATRYIEREENPICYQCYENLKKGSYARKDPETDADLVKQLKTILAADEE